MINWQGRHWATFNGPEQSEIERSGLRINYFGTKHGPVSVFEYKATLESVNQLSPWTNSLTGRVQLEAKYTWNYIAEKKKARNIELRGYLGKVGMLSDGRNPGRGATTENLFLMLSGASGQQDVFMMSISGVGVLRLRLRTILGVASMVLPPMDSSA